MRARRSLGQNFLVDPNLQRKIVESVEPGPRDAIVEIGPGRGALTDDLAERAGRLIAVELDPDLAAALQARFRAASTVEILHADILEWDPTELDQVGTVKVVGNIPYNITSPILFRLLEWRPLPERIIVMVQREVADRLRAEPGQKAYGALTVGVQAVADVDKQFDVGRQAFRPVPNVDSTVLRIRPRPDATADASLRALTRAAFGMRRKQLQKILRTAPGYGLAAGASRALLTELDIAPSARPETLSPDTFVRLADALRQRGYPTDDQTR